MSECKGLIARYTKNSYVTSDKFEVKESLNFLKRKSCKGCVDCGFDINTFIEFEADDDVFPCTDNLNSGDIVLIDITFSGNDDDYDYEITLKRVSR